MNAGKPSLVEVLRTMRGVACEAIDAPNKVAALRAADVDVPPSVNMRRLREGRTRRRFFAFAGLRDSELRGSKQAHQDRLCAGAISRGGDSDGLGEPEVMPALWWGREGCEAERSEPVLHAVWVGRL